MAKSFPQLLQQVKQQIREVQPEEVRDQLKTGQAPVLLDVREADEYQQGAIPGARHIPRGYLELRIEQEVPERDRPIVVYCAGGTRSALAAASLEQLGYSDVASMASGFNGWKNAGLPFEMPRTLNDAQRNRYSRHLLIPEVGEAGQMKLLDSKVLLIGAGGLGSPAALYLAAAGVGTIGLVDSDVVDESNLQRQILHNLSRVGQPKTSSARQTIEALNPDVKVVEHNERMVAENVLGMINDYDLIIDGADNFPTRYLLNDASLLAKKPVVHGSIFRFEGQLTVFKPYEGPCYRCLFPEPPPPELAPSCAEAGVLGVLPGIVGSLQASEAIKLLLGVGEPLVGRLLLFDALETSFRELKLRRNPHCPACGDHATLTGVADLDFSCALPQAVG
ncbi:MAG TPA: molybdopterin-synthase adenylyltransferase MoeB [Chloroflexota bacterium]|nr:molybdopterin-synthase adenylyltransferase MoeB [Chloroflexota bacterium]